MGTAIVNWLSQRGRLPILLAVVALPIFIMGCFSAFMQMGFFLAHDEAEHLHVVFALERGEIPYKDFIENHPALFHIAILWLKHALGLMDAMDVYWLGKGVVAVHFLGCLFLLMIFFGAYIRRSGGGEWSSLLVLVALCLSGIWNHSDVAHEYLWQFRPDWICYFYALLCVSLHYAYHCKLLSGWGSARLWMLLLAALAGGIATAIMAKSIYFFLPYFLTLVLLAIDRSEEAARIWQLHRRS